MDDRSRLRAVGGVGRHNLGRVDRRGAIVAGRDGSDEPGTGNEGRAHVDC